MNLLTAHPKYHILSLSGVFAGKTTHCHPVNSHKTPKQHNFLLILSAKQINESKFYLINSYI